MSDRIDRQAAIEAVRKLAQYDQNYGTIERCLEALRSLPEAADERWEKLRKWVQRRSADYVRFGTDPHGHLDDVLAEMDRLSSPPAERSDDNSCRVVTARIKLRNDNGPSGELSEPKEFVCVDGEYYEKDWIRSAPGVRAEQLEF